MKEGDDAAEMAARRGRLSRHLVGAGVELGPGHSPFPIPFPGIEVSYVDRWEPDENRELFPELGPAADFPMPDHVCNLDTDRLKALGDESQDFVIASHVLEHLAEPIGMLHDIHRVLRPGGIVLILLPDRRRTFDRGREPTSLQHLAAEFEAGLTEVDDDHVYEFVVHTEPPDVVNKHVLEASPEDRTYLFDLHRKRSLHVHCWSDSEFPAVIEYGIRELGHEWELTDAMLTDDEGPDGMEFGFVLRRSTVALPPETQAQRFNAALAVLVDGRRRQREASKPGEQEAPAEPVGLIDGLRGSARRVLQRSPALRRAVDRARAAVASRRSAR